MQRRRVTGQIQVYTRKTREKIIDIGMHFFHTEGVGEIARDVFSCVDELIKNAVKANYKFALIVDRLEKMIKLKKPNLSPEQLSQEVDSYIKDRQRFDAFADETIEKESLSGIVREVLNEEGMQIKIKNKIHEEKRTYTSDELDKLKGLNNLNMMRYKLYKRDVKVLVKMESDGEFIFIEVTNTAPIITKDLNRIYAKRDEFKIYREEAREHEFFLNNLDTSESGFGLGYATIDSVLGGMGLDPYQAIQIIAASDTTVIISFPLSYLRAKTA